MIQRLLHFLGYKKYQQRQGLSDFFLNTNPQEQKKILENAAHAANREQQILMKQYEKMHVHQN